MKRNTPWAISVLILLSLSVTAQINSRVGHQYTSVSHSDPNNHTSSVYNDDPADHVHEQVKIIKKVPLYAQVDIKEPADTLFQEAKDGISSSDTSSAAAISITDTDANVETISNTTVDSDCRCVSKTTIYTSIGLFGMAGLASIFMLSLLTANHKKLLLVAVADVVLSAMGMPLLTISTFYGQIPIFCLLLLLLAILCGLIIIYLEIMQKPIPKWLIYMHVILSFVGFILLLVVMIPHHT